MSLWRRLFGRSEAKPPATTGAPDDATVARAAAEAAEGVAPTEPTEPTEEQQAEDALLARLGRAGAAGGLDVSDAITLLRSHQGSTRQSRLLRAAVEGLGREDASLDPLRVACASLLEQRGQRTDAMRLLDDVRSVAAMMLAAELHAASGSLATAVSLIERVLARDIDAPGARERHQRWTGQLGRRPHRRRANDAATVVAPATQRTSFRLVREVARGGAGTIYEAEDELLGRRLAYKVYHRAEEDRDQIEREGQAAVRLAGPGIIRVLDAHPEAGWLATEWVAGGSMRDMLRAGRVAELLPLDRWMPALLAALARVHRADLVHSDLKPANVLFRDLDDPLLSDFGSCQPCHGEALLGTPGYLSPERLDGAAADPRDDVYAAGRIIEDVLAAREDGDLGPAELAASAADALRWSRVASRCLALAAERPQNASAILCLVPQRPEPDIGRDR